MWLFQLPFKSCLFFLSLFNERQSQQSIPQNAAFNMHAWHQTPSSCCTSEFLRDRFIGLKARASGEACLQRPCHGQVAPAGELVMGD